MNVLREICKYKKIASMPDVICQLLHTNPVSRAIARTNLRVTTLGAKTVSIASSAKLFMVGIHDISILIALCFYMNEKDAK